MKKKNSYHYLRKLYEQCCFEEIRTFKPGNVNLVSNISGLSKNKFYRAAQISSEKLTNINFTLGQSIYYSCKACLKELGTNYNLGIILLCAPIIRASWKKFSSKNNFLINLKRIIKKISLKESQYIIEAIKISKPAGMERYQSYGDIMSKNTQNLSFFHLANLSQDYDRISNCYANNYNEIFKIALPFYQSQKRKKSKFSVEKLFLLLLTIADDSHILRKFGHKKSSEIKFVCTNFFKRIQYSRHQNIHQNLIKLDNYLKKNYINPGTCADLTVTTLLIDKIMDIVKYSNYGNYA